MTKSRMFSTLLCAAVLMGVSAHASADPIELIGIGQLPGTTSDGLVLSPALLEDGVTPHDLVGGFGSAITYTGVGNRYLATPDRGPADGLTTYNDRYYALEINVQLGAATPVTVSLDEATVLVNEAEQAFTGGIAAFDATGSSASLRLDPEGIRLDGLGGFLVSDEYGPYLYRFDATGKRSEVLGLPSKLLISAPNAVATAELPPGNSSGRQANRGMEGLAISPDGTKLFGMMQNALIQDGALSATNGRIGLNNRIVEIDVATGVTRELVYVLDKASYGVNEIVAINDHELLAIERDSAVGAAAAFKQLFKIDVTGASDVSGTAALPTGALPAGVVPVQKAPFLDLLNPAFGLAGAGFPEKIEGLAFGPKLADGRVLLIVTSDNDFVQANSSKLYAFAIEPSLLAYQPQLLSTRVAVRPFLPWNIVRIGGRGVLPVAVYGSALLPVSALDRASLRVSGAPVAKLLGQRLCVSGDLDRDSFDDLLCAFSVGQMNLSPNQTTAVLSGVTTSGTPVTGSDRIRVVGR